MNATRGATKPHAFGVTLRRPSPNTPWGIRITGGADTGSAIVITRAQEGGEVRSGDIIRKIVDYDARDLRHEDAQTLFRKAGNTISLVIERDASTAATRPAPAAPVPGGVPTPFIAASTSSASSPKPFVNSATSLSPVSKPLNRAPSPIVFPPPLPSSQDFNFNFNLQQTAKQHVQFRPTEAGVFDEHDEELTAIANQPYRTTPLVLPGAKVKKEAASTSSYLRHHPNPKFRAPPSHYDTSAEVLMKQKVVHKQFNSPIGLYSDQNITETIHSQTGITPNNARVGTSTLNRPNQSKVSLRKTLSYDPAKSETFKALQEAELGDTVQEVTAPAQTRVFSASAQYKRAPGPQPYQHKVPAGPIYNTNSVGNTEEYIHQSGSFKRLMNQVLGESEY